MFGVVRASIRAFVVGVAVGVLFAPRPGADTRRMLNERITNAINQLLELAALPPVQPEQARTNGHSERPATTTKRSRPANTDARSS
jgi:gas vesicle protein